jgi:hypothetical protein
LIHDPRRTQTHPRTAQEFLKSHEYGEGTYLCVANLEYADLTNADLRDPHWSMEWVNEKIAPKAEGGFFSAHTLL